MDMQIANRNLCGGLGTVRLTTRFRGGVHLLATWALVLTLTLPAMLLAVETAPVPGTDATSAEQLPAKSASGFGNAGVEGRSLLLAQAESGPKEAAATPRNDSEEKQGKGKENEKAKEKGKKKQRESASKYVPGEEIFTEPSVLKVHILLAETNLNALRQHERQYTPVTIEVDGQTYTNVGVKLKGAAGSFRGVDDRPAMTVHVSKFASGQRVYGLRRFHLNNSVQDPTYMNEYLASEMFRSAGVPTPRVAWAKVRINDRDLGLYVLKEAFETEFLKLYFGSAKGNLYDGGFLRDIDQNLNRESGEGPADHSDLKRLNAVVREKDLRVRWEKFQKLLDVDKFTTYAAISIMVADWDGYPMNRNNYRIYFRPEDGRAVFMPHGMDQLFQRSYYELDASWTGSVAWSLFEIPQARELYEQRCKTIFTNVFRLDQMTNTIARVAGTLRRVQPDMDNRAADIRDAVKNRHRVLKRDEWLKPPSQPLPRPSDGPSAPTPAPASASAAPRN